MQTLAPMPTRPAYLRAASSDYEARRHLTVPSPAASRSPSPTPSNTYSVASSHTPVARWPSRPPSAYLPNDTMVPDDIQRRASPRAAPELSELLYLAPPPMTIIPLEVVEPDGSDSRSRAGAMLLRVFMVVCGMSIPVGLIWWGLSTRKA